MTGKRSKKSLIYKVKITSRAKRDIKSISKSHQIALSNIIEELKHDPLLGKALRKDLLGKYSYRLGAYRVIYIVNSQNQTITVLTVGHRSKVYKQKKG